MLFADVLREYVISQHVVVGIVLTIVGRTRARRVPFAESKDEIDTRSIKTIRHSYSSLDGPYRPSSYLKNNVLYF
jgi:hypothetical protein